MCHFFTDIHSYKIIIIFQYGTFVSEHIEYLVQPSKDNQSTYTVSKMLEKRPSLFDYQSLSDTGKDIENI
jgi:hypothetical protein